MILTKQDLELEYQDQKYRNRKTLDYEESLNDYDNDKCSLEYSSNCEESEGLPGKNYLSSSKTSVYLNEVTTSVIKIKPSGTRKKNKTNKVVPSNITLKKKNRVVPLRKMNSSRTKKSAFARRRNYTESSMTSK